MSIPEGAQPRPDRLLRVCPELVRIKSGDTIDFIASDKGHDVHSVNGMIPDGAQPIDGKTNQDTKVTLSKPGVYVIAYKVCTRLWAWSASWSWAIP